MDAADAMCGMISVIGVVLICTFAELVALPFCSRVSLAKLALVCWVLCVRGGVSMDCSTHYLRVCLIDVTLVTNYAASLKSCYIPSSGMWLFNRSGVLLIPRQGA